MSPTGYYKLVPLVFHVAGLVIQGNGDGSSISADRNITEQGKMEYGGPTNELRPFTKSSETGLC